MDGVTAIYGITEKNSSPIYNMTRAFVLTGFPPENVMAIIVYSILMVIAGIGNLTVFITLYRNRQKRSRVSMFIINLCIADLWVTFIFMPLEIAWHATVSWQAGDAMCRIMMFFRAFGFYLSSFVLIAISADRYCAVARPLSISDSHYRGKIMMCTAWLCSFAASVPQSVVFHVEQHPDNPNFHQCMTANFFPSPAAEMIYNLFHILALYLLPLTTIIIFYSLILYEISTKARETRAQTKTSETRHIPPENGLRRSGLGRIEQARSRTLKMTIVIVSVFIICWTPYFVISAWWWIDSVSAGAIDPKVSKGLFLFAVSNSCVNPIVYGVFSTNFLKVFPNCCKKSSRNQAARIPQRFNGVNHLTPVHKEQQMADVQNHDLHSANLFHQVQYAACPLQLGNGDCSSPTTRVRLLKRMDSSITLSESPEGSHEDLSASRQNQNKLPASKC